MTFIDKLLQKIRISQAQKFLRKNDSVLDIGSVDGVMFERWKDIISKGLGIDPTLDKTITTDLYTLIPGYFPEACPKGEKFDVITMLAVLEHIPLEQQKALANNCHDMLNKNGRVIITVPSPRVDDILEVLLKLKLIHGMSLEEHYGFLPEHTRQIFSDSMFRLVAHQTFQLGLNNLFVFEKIG